MRINRFVCLLLIIFINNAAYGRDLCNEYDTVIGFFNGVWNEDYEAVASKEVLEKTIQTNIERIDIDHTKVKYELFYNDTDGKLADLLELFIQRANEMGNVLKDDFGNIKFEYFNDFVNQGRTWRSKFSPASLILGFFFDKAVTDFTVEHLKLRTKDNYKAHEEIISKNIEDNLKKDGLKGVKFLFVAHSQGNLFANVAFDYVKSLEGYRDREAVKLVHVAPASIKLNGEYVLVDIDIVINGFLALLPGHTFAPTDTLRNILPVAITTALAELSMPLKIMYFVGFWAVENLKKLLFINARQEVDKLTKDPAGHAFVETYLNPNYDVVNSVLKKINNAVRDFEVPNLGEVEEVKEGFFSAMITWDGLGDIDLRILEPDNNIVDAWNKEGNSGELDIDNRVGFGPEYYHTSCDSNKLQTGIYQIMISNYGSFAECKPDQENCELPPPFRKVDLLISSNENGELISKSIILGNDRKINKGFYMIDLEVKKNILNNKYSLEIINSEPRLITNWIIKNKP